MPKTVRMRNTETGIVRDVYAIDAETYDETWERVGDTPDTTPQKVVTTTMGKPIKPKEAAAKSDR
jgi:hypothetical protein